MEIARPIVFQHLCFSERGFFPCNQNYFPCYERVMLFFFGVHSGKHVVPGFTRWSGFLIFQYYIRSIHCWWSKNRSISILFYRSLWFCFYWICVSKWGSLCFSNQNMILAVVNLQRKIHILSLWIGLRGSLSTSTETFTLPARVMLVRDEFCFFCNLIVWMFCQQKTNVWMFLFAFKRKGDKFHGRPCIACFAGHYVPQLSQVIFRKNQGVQNPVINFKGFMVWWIMLDSPVRRNLLCAFL